MKLEYAMGFVISCRSADRKMGPHFSPHSQSRTFVGLFELIDGFVKITRGIVLNCKIPGNEKPEKKT